jgi:hypothetical protein
MENADPFQFVDDRYYDQMVRETAYKMLTERGEISEDWISSVIMDAAGDRVALELMRRANMRLMFKLNEARVRLRQYETACQICRSMGQ